MNKQEALKEIVKCKLTGNFYLEQHQGDYRVFVAKPNSPDDVDADARCKSSSRWTFLGYFKRGKAVVEKKSKKNPWQAQFIKFDEREYLLVTNIKAGDVGKYILSASDCYHYIRSMGESVVLEQVIQRATGRGDGSYYLIPQAVELSLEELLALKTKKKVTKQTLADWIHYFGVKERVRMNYFMLGNSLLDIGIDPLQLLPDWNE